MAGRTEHASYNDFSAGMISDTAPHLVPDNAVAAAYNMMITKSGALTQRGATTTYTEAASGLAFQRIGTLNSSGADNLSAVYMAQTRTVFGSETNVGSMWNSYISGATSESGNLTVLGFGETTGSAVGSGNAFVISRSYSNTMYGLPVGLTTSTIVSPSATISGAFGTAVAMSRDANYTFISAPGVTPPSGPGGTGVVYAYRTSFSPAGTPTLTLHLGAPIVPVIDAGSSFGRDVTCSANGVAFAVSDSNRIYVYRFITSGYSRVQSIAKSSSTSIAMSGDGLCLVVSMGLSNAVEVYTRANIDSSFSLETTINVTSPGRVSLSDDKTKILVSRPGASRMELYTSSAGAFSYSLAHTFTPTGHFQTGNDARITPDGSIVYTSLRADSGSAQTTLYTYAQSGSSWVQFSNASSSTFFSSPSVTGITRPSFAVLPNKMTCVTVAVPSNSSTGSSRYVFGHRRPEVYFTAPNTSTSQIIGTTSLASNLSNQTNGNRLGLPFQYGNSVIFPLSADSVPGSCSSPFITAGGGINPSESISITVGSYALTANKSELALDAALLDRIAVGTYIVLSSTTNEYAGRVTSKRGQGVVLDPPPTITHTYTNLISATNLWVGGTLNDGEFPVEAACGAVFSSGGDSRIVLGNVSRFNVSAGTVTRYANRIYWSVRDAADTTIATPTTSDGQVQFLKAGWPSLNYIEIDDIGSIVALVPIGSGNMLVLGTENTVMLSGSLLTQTATRGGLTANIRAFPKKVGCLSDRSVQLTQRGVLFAASDGVYLCDGANLVNIMDGKVAEAYTSAMAIDSVTGFQAAGLANATAASVGMGEWFVENKILGSVNAHNRYYYLSTMTGGYVCDLSRSSLGWTIIPQNSDFGGPQVQVLGAGIFLNSADRKIYALRNLSYVNTGSAVRVILLDNVFADDPALLTGFDVDGVEVQSYVITKAYAPGSVTQLKRFRSSLITVNRRQSSGGGVSALNTRVWAIPGINSVLKTEKPSTFGTYRFKDFPSDIVNGLQTFRMDLNDSTRANPTTQGMSLVISTTGAMPFELLGVGLSYNQLRYKRTTQ